MESIEKNINVVGSFYFILFYFCICVDWVVNWRASLQLCRWSSCRWKMKGTRLRETISKESYPNGNLVCQELCSSFLIVVYNLRVLTDQQSHNLIFMCYLQF
jgi:hypothetical protein